jgi:hypothetical protein
VPPVVAPPEPEYSSISTKSAAAVPPDVAPPLEEAIRTRSRAAVPPLCAPPAAATARTFSSAALPPVVAPPLPLHVPIVVPAAATVASAVMALESAL